MMKAFVYLFQCPSYDVNSVASAVTHAFQENILPKPSGRVVIKPNLVMAHPKVATEGYTRKEVVEGVLKWLKQHQDVKDIKIVEKSGLGVTTACMYKHAGYRSFKREYGVDLVAMEESRQQRVVLETGKVHSWITASKAMVDADYLIFTPKLKTNVLSDGYSGAVKLNIGSIDSKERTYCHHHALPQKMVDILEVFNPDLIVTDGIRFAFGGNQMTQHGTDFGVLAISNNAVAHDLVCANLLGLDSGKIEHIQEAISRNLGPASLDEINIQGNFDFEAGKRLAASLDFGNVPVETVNSPFAIHAGTPYCKGGCHGIFLDWLYMIKDRKPGLMKRFPKIPVIIGKTEKEIEAGTVLMIGNCAQASPHVKAKRRVCIGGCPPTHKWIVLNMLIRFFIINPLVRLDLIWDGFVAYPFKKSKGWVINRFSN